VDIEAALRENSVVPVAIIDDADNALPLVDALVEGGITTIELTLRTEGAAKAIDAIAKHRPDFVLGAGTVLSVDELQMCADFGVKYAVSPGLSPEVVEHAARLGLTFYPGVMTPSEVQRALSLGCRIMKLFPAEAAGGLLLLRSLHSAYGHVGVKFIPLGGLDRARSEIYLRERGVLAVGGSWVCPRRVIADHDWPTIAQNARDAAAMKLLNE
jgi:2-dehydro-3-deoxyphosphogluconate aldolase/(4S)-4-hydroxy-2-oxoglutarate aldolase